MKKRITALAAGAQLGMAFASGQQPGACPFRGATCFFGGRVYNESNIFQRRISL